MTVAVLAFLGIAVSACVAGPSPSAPGPTPVPTAFVITVGGTSTPVRSADDCASLGDPWFSEWCRDLAAYRPGDVPATLEGRIDRETVAMIYAGLAWSLLHGDDAICDNPLVGTFLSFSATPPSPMPSPSVPPAQHCRDDLQITLGLAQAHDNAINLTSPDTQVDGTVALPNGQPLPTLPPT